MEYLTKLQRIWAIVDLCGAWVSKGETLWSGHTTSIPVTLTRRLATVPEDGCASFVVTWCCTFWNGRDWKRRAGGESYCLGSCREDIPPASPRLQRRLRSGRLQRSTWRIRAVECHLFNIEDRGRSRSEQDAHKVLPDFCGPSRKSGSSSRRIDQQQSRC
jgi:hypothetical protein